MELDEMRAVWNAQTNRLTFSLDSEELLASVRRRSAKLKWAVTLEEFMVVFVCVFFPYINGFYSGEHAYETVGAVIFGGVALFALWQRMRRIQRERTFDATIVGELDRSLHRVDCQIWRARYFALWFLLPTAVYSVISMTQHFTKVGFVAALIGYPLTFLGLRFAWRFGYARERRSLVALRDELTG